jgi:hypothetical protein
VLKTNQKGKINMKAMTKYQLEHFKTKVKDKFAPMIEEVDLSLRKSKKTPLIINLKRMRSWALMVIAPIE